MHKEIVKVGLVQIGDKFGSQYYLPYSIGLLQAYAQKHLANPEKYAFSLPIYKRLKVKQVLEQLLDSDIVFFSSYVWNHQLSLKVAKTVKEVKPDCIVVFGGPQVPEEDKELERFLNDNSFIDIGCYSEGEIPFLRILEELKRRSWRNVPSIGFFDKGEFIYNSINERVLDLDKVPSPYLEKVFDPLMAAYPDESWSALLETNRGCPFRCSYCYWGKQTRSRISQYDIERVFEEINWMSHKRIEFIFCCDANFGLLRRDLDIAKKVAINKEDYGYPKAFSVQSTKNSTKEVFNLQKVLNDSDLQKGVNLALQSVNEASLRSINRSNIDSRTYQDLQKMFTKDKVSTFSDIIIGLPEETYQSFTEGVSNIISNGQHNRIQFINLAILENTEMAQKVYQKNHGLLIQETKAIAHHTSLEDGSGVYEIQNLVVGTNSLPKQDWVKARVFAWIISLFYFNKLLQIPFILINKLYSLTYRELTEVFMSQASEFDELSKIVKSFTDKAREIQEGGCEHVVSSDWLGIWWPADEYVFIQLCLEGRLCKFYQQAQAVFEKFLKNKGFSFDPKLLEEAIKLNRALIKLPFVHKNFEITLDYNIWELYQGVLAAEDVALEKGKFTYIIDREGTNWMNWEDWLREVIWYGTKKGAYIYPCWSKDKARLS